MNANKKTEDLEFECHNRGTIVTYHYATTRSGREIVMRVDDSDGTVSYRWTKNKALLTVAELARFGLEDNYDLTFIECPGPRGIVEYDRATANDVANHGRDIIARHDRSERPENQASYFWEDTGAPLTREEMNRYKLDAMDAQ